MPSAGLTDSSDKASQPTRQAGSSPMRRLVGGKTCNKSNCTTICKYLANHFQKGRINPSKKKYLPGVTSSPFLCPQTRLPASSFQHLFVQNKISKKAGKMLFPNTMLIEKSLFARPVLHKFINVTQGISETAFQSVLFNISPPKIVFF